MAKISSYSPNNTPQTTDYLLGNSSSGPTTKKFLLSDLITLFLNNIPAAEGSFGFISSGGVWSGDAYASTRAASMTAMRVKVNTTFLSIAAVTARLFTASRDTYVDVLDNGDGTGTLVYTEVTNNAASPALAANSIRVAIIVTGASNIANVGSINQGQQDKVLPIASSIAYSVGDSLGNLICPRDPTRRLIGYRQILTSSPASTTSSTMQTVGPLTVPVIVPDGRKVKVELSTAAVTSSGGAGTSYAVGLARGSAATIIAQMLGVTDSGAGNGNWGYAKAVDTPGAGSFTYLGAYGGSGSATTVLYAAATAPTFVSVELE